MIYDAIRQYSNYFRSEIDKIERIDNRLYSKILIVTLIDALARARFPDMRRNHDRFVKMIDTCAQWKEANRVSLYQLGIKLSVDSSTCGNSLEQEVSRRLSGWNLDVLPNIEEMDPWEIDLKPLLNSSVEGQLLNECRHLELFYTYRNHLVHEFREPGGALEFSDNPDPHYHSLTHLDGSDDTWELVYPAEFFLKTAKNCVTYLEIYLRDNYINPYSLYTFGTFWNP